MLMLCSPSPSVVVRGPFLPSFSCSLVRPCVVMDLLVSFGVVSDERVGEAGGYAGTQAKAGTSRKSEGQKLVGKPT